VKCYGNNAREVIAVNVIMDIVAAGFWLLLAAAIDRLLNRYDDNEKP